MELVLKVCVVNYKSHKILGINFKTMKLTISQNVHQYKAVLIKVCENYEAFLSGLNSLTIPIFNNLVSLNKQTTAWVTEMTKKKGVLCDLLRYPGIGVCVEGLNEVAKLC